MDHDTHERRLARVEKFLDANARGWREEEQWGRMRGNAGGDRDEPGWKSPAAGQMHVDEDQTLRDRRALGLEPSGDQPQQQPDPSQQAGARAPAQAVITAAPASLDADRRAALLVELDPFKGMDGVSPWDGTETIEQLEGILADARARKAVMDSASTET